SSDLATGLRRRLRYAKVAVRLIAPTRPCDVTVSPGPTSKGIDDALHLPAQATLSESVAPIGAASSCTWHYRQPGHRRRPGAVAAGRRQRRPVGGAGLAFRIDPPLDAVAHGTQCHRWHAGPRIRPAIQTGYLSQRTLRRGRRQRPVSALRPATRRFGDGRGAGRPARAVQ